MHIDIQNSIHLFFTPMAHKSWRVIIELDDEVIRFVFLRKQIIIKWYLLLNSLRKNKDYFTWNIFMLGVLFKLLLTVYGNVHCGLTRVINPLTPNEPYRGRTAPLTSKRCILYIYSTNIGTEYFKHGICSPFFPLQNAACFIILTYLVPVLFTFYLQGVLKLQKNNSVSKRLK